jgi:hypothetical protein
LSSKWVSGQDKLEKTFEGLDGLIATAPSSLLILTASSGVDDRWRNFFCILGEMDTMSRKSIDKGMQEL